MNLLSWHLAFSQCPNYSGNINSLPVCGQYGDANGNSNWNWELTDKNDPAYCNLWYARTDAGNNLTPMRSPFVDASLTALDIISQEQDFTRARGWELLRRDFGCSRVTAYPYFILYNKYSGLMRVFIYAPASQPQYSGLAVEVLPNLAGAYPATTAFADTIQTAPDKFLTSSQNAAFGKGITAIGKLAGAGQWSLVELNPSFDPNIQNVLYSGASLQFTIYGVTNNLMYASIKGGSMTNTQPVYNFTYKPTQPKVASADGQSFDFKGVGEKFTKFSTSINDVREGVYSTATGIVGALSSVNDSTTLLGKVKNFFTEVKNNSETTSKFGEALGSISKALKGAGGVLKAIGTVLGLFSKSPGSPAAMPTYTSYDLVLQGTITTKVIQSSFVLRVPGTLQPNNDNATYYKCPMGNFNIKNTPEADVVTYDRVVTAVYTGQYLYYAEKKPFKSYRLKNNLIATYNDMAGLDLVSVQAAIVGEVLPNADGTASYDLFKFNSPLWPGALQMPGDKYIRLNHQRPDLEAGRLEIKHYDKEKGLHIFQTPYVNLECINGLTFNAEATTRIYLQVKAILKIKNDPENKPIYFIQNYNIQTSTADISTTQRQAYNDPSLTLLPPFANYTVPPTYYSDLVYINDYFLFGFTADNSITLQDNAVITPGEMIHFTAGSSIRLLPGFEAQAGSEFSASIVNFGYNISCQSPQVEPFTLAGSCYNTSITALRTVNPEQASTIEETNKALNVYPSLSNGVLRVEGTNLQQSYITVVDQSGRVVYQYHNSSDKNYIQLNLQHLANGMYFIQVKGAQGTTVKKVLINK
jgi:hypothetical protein